MWRRYLNKLMRQSRIRWWTPRRPRGERRADDANTCAAPVRAASTALGWGLHAATGAGARTTHAPEAALLSAVGGVLAMLAGFGAIGAAAALVRGKPKRAAGKPEPAPVAAPIRRGA